MSHSFLLLHNGCVFAHHGKLQIIPFFVDLLSGDGFCHQEILFLLLVLLFQVQSSQLKFQIELLISQHCQRWDASCLFRIQVVHKNTFLRQDLCSLLMHFEKSLDFNMITLAVALGLNINLLPRVGTQLQASHLRNSLFEAQTTLGNFRNLLFTRSLKSLLHYQIQCESLPQF